MDDKQISSIMLKSKNEAQDVRIVIQSLKDDKIFIPVTCDDVRLHLERKGSPGKLTLKVKNDDVLSFHEGNPITLQVNGVDMFAGFVFKKSRKKDHIITVTAYDQTRYLKNKDVMSYTNKTASEVIKMIANDYKLPIGDIVDTKHIIPQRRENNITLLDMIQTALNITLMATKERYVFYDDYRKLTLKNIKDMGTLIHVEPSTASDYNYDTSIDNNTYNQIKLYYDDKDAGVRRLYYAKDSRTIALWGLLQYTEAVNDKSIISREQQASALLALHNDESRRLKLVDQIGDLRIRPGSSFYVSLDLGDLILDKLNMYVESVTHKWKSNVHTMDLDVRGERFV